MTIDAQRLRANLSSVRERIERAAARTGRGPNSVRLVAVTKTVSPETARQLFALGCVDLAESRPQQLWEKASSLPDATWHLIGHLQRNKIARTLPCAAWLHSVDSSRLLTALELAAAGAGLTPRVLLEVNISGEPAKQGWNPDDLPPALETMSLGRSFTIEGLMGMAGLQADESAVHEQFAALRRLSERVADSLTPPHGMRELSMGMSHDFEIAIEEGATMVRIGSAIFEGCDEI
ncbi:MAG TPA: YggS family pyridoxal phosphate-dependent enzyme [Pirellulaceae bacterium]